MLYAIVLFCSLNIAPVNCDEASATRYEHVPGGNELPMMCFREARCGLPCKASNRVLASTRRSAAVGTSSGIRSDDDKRAKAARPMHSQTTIGRGAPGPISSGVSGLYSPPRRPD